MNQPKIDAIINLLKAISAKKGTQIPDKDKKYILAHWIEDLSCLSQSQIELFSKDAILNVDFETKIVISSSEIETIFPDSRKFEAFVIPKLLSILINDINKSLGEKSAVSSERIKEIFNEWLPRVDKWRIATFLKTRNHFLESWESYGKFPEISKFLTCKCDVPKMTIHKQFKQTEEGAKKRVEFFNKLKGE